MTHWNRPQAVGPEKPALAGWPFVFKSELGGGRRSGPGWVALYPCAAGYQGTSTVNFAGGPAANAVVADASSGVCARSSTAVDVIVDQTALISS